MSKEQQELPYKNLGERLKTIRQKLHESVAEVSGAVEIDERALSRIEAGAERPSEDILMLLISHFGMQEDEAAGLWQLAGYEPPQPDQDQDEHVHNHNARATILVMAVDPRVIYSDSVQVHANPNGVVIAFAQANGTPQGLTTARIGMSREQARNVIRTLQSALNYSEPRQLPGGPNTAGEQSND